MQKGLKMLKLPRLGPDNMLQGGKSGVLYCLAVYVTKGHFVFSKSATQKIYVHKTNYQF